MMRVSGAVSELQVGPKMHLFADPLCSLQGLVITEVVALRDDLLVGYEGGCGSWYSSDPANPTEVVVMTDLRETVGQLFLPKIVCDRRSMRLIHQWCADHTRLESVVARDYRVVALADIRHRNAVIAELSFRV